MPSDQISEPMISDTELRARFRNFEDPFVERKVAGDIRDCLKTALAFANTLPNGMPGVLFIPVRNDGTIQTGVNLDDLQRSISKRLADAFPDLLYFQRIVTITEEQVVAVVVPGSLERPHFAGHAYVRDGSSSVKASRQQFDALVARRSSLVEEIHRWIRKPVSLLFIRPDGMGGPRVHNTYDAAVAACNQWVTLEYNPQPAPAMESFSLHRVQLSYDHKRDRLAIEVQT